MPTIPDVKVLPPVSPEGEGATIPPTVPVTPPAQPGDKTESALLLKSLQEEREKRKDLEARLKELEDAVASGDTLSAEGKVLKTQIEKMKGTITSLTRSSEIATLQGKFPVLHDKTAEFEAYVGDPKNAGMSLETAAKSFIIDNDLHDAPRTRKGVEKPSGGGRITAPQGWTFASVEELRVNNFRRYSQLLKAGEFKDLTS